MAKGKYAEWLTADGLLRLEMWARDGLTDADIAKKCGINANTLYEWMNKYGEICEAIKRGKRPVDFEVENALLKRAKGAVYREIRTEVNDSGETKTVTIEKEIPPDTVAAIFWLKNRRPDRWRDKPEAAETEQVESSGLIEALKDAAGMEEDDSAFLQGGEKK